MPPSNVSSVVDYFTTPNEGFTTTLGSTIAAGATTVPLNATTNLTNGTVFVGIIEPGATNEQVFTGIVNTGAGTITGVVWTRGTNVGHATGVSIVDYVTGTAFKMMATGILKQHTQTGTHTGITTDTLAASGNVTIGGTAAITGAISGAGYSVATIKNPYKFSVYLASNQTVIASTDTKVTLNTENFDTGSNFDSVTNYRFVAPINGFYFFNANALNNGNGIFNLFFKKNGNTIRLGNDLNPGSNISGGLITELLQLSASDYVELWINSANTTIQGDTSYPVTYMSGFLVSAT